MHSNHFSEQSTNLPDMYWAQKSHPLSFNLVEQRLDEFKKTSVLFLLHLNVRQAETPVRYLQHSLLYKWPCISLAHRLCDIPFPECIELRAFQ